MLLARTVGGAVLTALLIAAVYLVYGDEVTAYVAMGVMPLLVALWQLAAGQFAQEMSDTSKNALIDRLRKELEESETATAVAAAAINATSTGVLVVGADGTIELVNPALRRLVRVRPDALGHTPVEAVPVPEILDAIDRVRKGRVSPRRDVVSGDKDLLMEAHGMGDRVLIILRDVTQTRATERARTDFVANVSHELRTPIAAIRGYAETLALESDRLPEDVRFLVKVVERNARRLAQLFNDLLHLYRIEARRRELTSEEIHLLPFLQEALVDAADLAAQRDQTFELDCPEDLESYTNPEALSAIIGNLANNACKYTEAGGTITVSARQMGDVVQIDVADTGIGIPSEALGRIFERFYRVDEGRSRAMGGTGLGLAIVKHLAEASNCRVSVASVEGKGSTFSVHLPAARDPVQARRWEDGSEVWGD